MKVDFATFCHPGDAHRLYAPGQLAHQVLSNAYHFENIIVINQLYEPQFSEVAPAPVVLYEGENGAIAPPIKYGIIGNLDDSLKDCGIDIDKPQYESRTDKAHSWKPHVVNHLVAATHSEADYVVFADNDCWMVRQPEGESWIDRGIAILQTNSDVFIVSPCDGEPERKTHRFSQQMFLVNLREFKNADFNQPGWDGNTSILGGPMPEYWGMLEGRMELYCRTVGKYRYVLGEEYRYYHHNKLTKEDLFETDMSKY